MSDRESRRQLVHFLAGAPALLLPFIDRSTAIGMAGVALAINALVLPRLAVTRRLFRPGERVWTSGVVLFPTVVLALLLTLPGYPITVVGAWSVLAAGDSASSWFGRRFGRRRLPFHPTKTWIGSLAFVLAAALWTTGALIWCGLGLHDAWRLALIVSAVGATVEAMPLPVDDNLTTGIGAGLAMWMTSAAFGLSGSAGGA